ERLVRATLTLSRELPAVRGEAIRSALLRGELRGHGLPTGERAHAGCSVEDARALSGLVEVRATLRVVEVRVELRIRSALRELTEALQRSTLRRCGLSIGLHA